MSSHSACLAGAQVSTGHLVRVESSAQGTFDGDITIGRLYLQRGLESAMMVHFSGDKLIHVIMP